MAALPDGLSLDFDGAAVERLRDGSQVVHARLRVNRAAFIRALLAEKGVRVASPVLHRTRRVRKP